MIRKIPLLHYQYVSDQEEAEFQLREDSEHKGLDISKLQQQLNEAFEYLRFPGRYL